MKPYSIAFFDIDGTLVDPTLKSETFIGGVPASAKEAITKLKETGILPVIATGRGKEGVGELAQGLGIDSFITSNGQEITCEGEQIHVQCIDQPIIDELFHEFKARRIDVLYETTAGVYALPSQEKIVAKQVPIRYLEHGAVPQDVLQLIVHTEDNGELEDWLTALKVVKVAPVAANILPFGVSKASGIHFLLEQLGLSVEASLAFGDEENDLEMFSAVGTAIAMGNATEALKANADFITKEVWNDGIYHACEVLKLF